jgi:hypothetical protein
MSEVRIEPLRAELAGEAAWVLARAFMTNPLHAAAFGPDQLTKNQAFFRIGLAAMRGPKLVALDGQRMLGLVHWVNVPGCRYSWSQKLSMMPAMIGDFGLGPAMRVGRWLSAWGAHDPAEDHVHLGPIGVAPEAQGRHATPS